MSLENRISNWLKEYLFNHKLDSFVIGVSGGIDSAVTSTLCAMTGEKIIVVIMPIHQNPNQTNFGLNHCNWLKNKYKNVDIVEIELSSSFEELKQNIPIKFHDDLSLANTRAPLRMTTLYLIAASSKGIVVGIGNKVEDFGVGFFTKYGDGGVDISPIADLMKSEVYNLGKRLGINEEILNAKPTDGLWDDNRTDEDQLGVSYDDLEWAMKYDSGHISDKQQNILNVYNKHREANLHKMQKIPVFKKK